MPISVAWGTDLHLNFVDEPTVRALARRIQSAGPRAVILTGDIAEAPSLGTTLGWFAREIDAPVYFVLGNHDYYRDSIARVRGRAERFIETWPNLVYLSSVGPVALGAMGTQAAGGASGLGLVGVDGWGDARLGDALTSGVWLNDFRFIEDLQGRLGAGLWARLGELGDAEAAALRPKLAAALERFETVLIATHVPPFAEACWHEGRISAPDWLPYFSCKAVGDVLVEAADAHPDRRLIVLCGHTHSEGVARMRPNLEVRTDGARYGHPAFRMVTFE